MADTPHAPETTHDYAKDADKPGLLVVVWLAVLGLAAANVLIAMSGFGSHTYIRLPMTEMGMSVALITQLLIGAVQAVLVAYHFMHLKQGDKVVTLTALASIFWTGILFVLFLVDFASRKWVVG